MKTEIRNLITAAIKEYPAIKKLASTFFGSNLTVKKMLLQADFLKQQIYSHYSKESLDGKMFYNFGAGNQRSSFPFWSYVDLKSDTYNHEGIDIFYDLESKEPLPLPENEAEVIFNSFVIEHISKEATLNFCKEAYKALKSGGVFHSKIHSFDYGLMLLDRGLISPKIPFEERESREKLNSFIRKHKGKVGSTFKGNSYQIFALKNPKEFISFSPADAFVYHNAVAAMKNLKTEFNDTVSGIAHVKEGKNSDEFYNELRTNYVDQAIKQPYQHNADYFGQNELKKYLEDLGFNKVYFTQPYQSSSPALWEEKLNPMHYGFLFSIEAIK